MFKQLKVVALSAVVSIGIVACGAAPEAPTDGVASALKYDANLRWTELGIPHIEAKDWGSLGYGMGYTFAEDNLCTLMEDIVTIRGERSKYFGRNGPGYSISANGSSATNINSDFFWKHVANDTKIASFGDAQSQKVKDAIQGYADGFSRYIREVKNGEQPGRQIACASEDWLFEITFDDMVRRILRLAILAGSSVFVDEIGSIQPPAGGAPAKPTTSKSQDEPTPEEWEAQIRDSDAMDRYPFSRELPIGSNMYALGKDATQSGESLQFVNPHFPWYGTERLHLSHLKLVGETEAESAEIMGVALHGSPAILIGFNEHFAWSHTVSSAYRFTIYELTLGGDPTTYVYDNEIRNMEATEYTIEVMEDNGELSDLSRTLYRSHYGPIMNLHISNGTGPFNWTASNAYAIRDVNAENIHMMEHFFRWNSAKSLEEFEAVQDELVAVPWVNTTATGPGKHVYYSDRTSVPNVPDSMVTAGPNGCSNSALAPVLANLAPGLPLLDGNAARCEWVVDPAAPRPGVFAAEDLPNLRRDDWVTNCNDSYWLTNPDEPLAQHPAILGDFETERSLRTRKCIRQVQQRLDGTDGRAGTKFTRENLKEIVLSGEVYTAELALGDAVTALCDNNPTKQAPTSGGPSVDVTDACTVLAAWDGTVELESVGGHIWREFWRNARSINTGFWTNGYSNADPVNTPNTLNSTAGLAELQQAFGDAVATLNGAGLAMDAELGDIQWAERNGVKIPVFGDTGSPGAFTIAVAPLNNDGTGYGPVDYGNSYVQIVGWDSQGNPEADAFITYSQSTDATSEHYADYTEAYSRKEWKRLPYTNAQIEAEKVRELRLTE
jgi:acyl-homoserine-lactone acylase